MRFVIIFSLNQINWLKLHSNIKHRNLMKRVENWFDAKTNHIIFKYYFSV